jgi:hypothetical protein
LDYKSRRDTSHKRRASKFGGDGLDGLGYRGFVGYAEFSFGHDFSGDVPAMVAI